jgi:hypothetical protein
MWGLPKALQEIIGDESAGSSENPLGRFIHQSCRIADYLGFPVLDREWEGPDPVEEFVNSLHPSLSSRLSIKPSELQILIASQVNALEA